MNWALRSGAGYVMALVFMVEGALLGGCAGRVERQAGLELVILHTNDTHSFLAGMDRYGNACLEDGDCSGGLGRVAAAVKAAREGKDNVIAVDAGDQFQGTLFYSVNKWPMIVEVDRAIPWDAMTLGNHEFDEGCAELARFLEKTPTPVLAANLEAEEGCPLHRGGIVPHIVKVVRGEKVAVVGLANDEVKTLSSACAQTHFDEAAETLSREVEELKAQGVKYIVAVTHLGLPVDRALARRVDGVDVIVGGHTHSYLGPEPSDGPYPVVEHSPDGSPVLVVTTGRGAKYLGKLTVNFDEKGVPVAWSGSALELSADMPVDPAVRELVIRYGASLEELRSEVVGVHHLSLPDGMDLCREEDCLGGMVTADAMLEASRPLGAEIALCNGGAIRAAFPAGNITRGDLLSVHPFGNVAVLREYTGARLLAALEHGVAQEGGVGPRLLQVAGLSYEVDASRPAGARILKAEVMDEQGKVGPVAPENRYVVVLADYLADGGDGYAMLKEGNVVPSSEELVVDMVEAYLRKHSPLPMPKGGRIVRVGQGASADTSK